MNKDSRRRFLTRSGKLIVGTAAFGSLAAHAAGEHHHHASEDGMVVDATRNNTCATCQYWGGMRKVSEDQKQVTAQSMGWCNNPDSPNHRKLTAADHQMNKPGIWKKWDTL